MSGAGDSRDGLGADAADRLAAHVARIVAAAGVPSRARDNVTEELLGHLLERVDALRAQGASESDAVDRALADFGGVDELSADLSSAFHSRLWMSTVGVLLPAVVPAPDRPGVIGWIRFAFGIGIALSVVGIAVTGWLGTPGHAVLVISLLLLSVGGLLLAFHALARGQRWALWYGIGFATLLVVSGVISVLMPEVPGTFTIPLGALLGAAVLLGIASDWDRLQAFVEESRPIGAGLAALIVVSLLGPVLAGPVMAALPDPTQATADDLRLTLTVTCDRGDVEEPGFPTQDDVQRVTIVADMAWRRGDLLPNGLDGLVNPLHYGDTAGFRLLDGAMGDVIPEWVFVPREPQVIDVASGEPAGWFGGGSPSVGLLPDTIGSFTVGIDPDSIRGGHTLRATWLLVPSADRDEEWPRVEVAYAHLDRFLLLATAGCGETAVGVPSSLPD